MEAFKAQVLGTAPMPRIGADRVNTLPLRRILTMGVASAEVRLAKKLKARAHNLLKRSRNRVPTRQARAKLSQ